MKKRLAYATVPRLCPGGTVLCLAGGPSLTRADVETCRGRCDAVIAVNNAYQIAPWATVLYAADARWWRWHKGAMGFAGLKYSLSADIAAEPWGVQILQNTGDRGLEVQPTGLRTGRNGGYQAINLAVHVGAARIVLLGYDLQPGPKGEAHWHPNHPAHVLSPYGLFRDRFATLVEPLAAAGVTVINCSPRTALTCFPRAPLTEVLTNAVAA